jgi:hypothetical protein
LGARGERETPGAEVFLYSIQKERKTAMKRIKEERLKATENLITGGCKK